MNNQKDARSALADNMKRLMENWGLSKDHLTEKTGCSWFAIACMMRGDEYAHIDIRLVEKVAQVFELQAWQLLMPDLPMGVYLARAIVDKPWPEDRRIELSKLKKLLGIMASLNESNQCLNRLQEAVIIAEELTEFDCVEPRASFSAWLGAQAAGYGRGHGD